MGGIDAIVSILNSVDRGTEKHIMESLEIEEPELADEIRKKMFVFEDILFQDEPRVHRLRVIGILQELVDEMSLIRVFFDNAVPDSDY